MCLSVGGALPCTRLRARERPGCECSAQVDAWGRGESKFPGGNGCG